MHSHHMSYTKKPIAKHFVLKNLYIDRNITSTLTTRDFDHFHHDMMSTMINSFRCFFIPLIKTALNERPFSSSHSTATAAAVAILLNCYILQTHQKRIHNVSFTGCFMTLYMDEI